MKARSLRVLHAAAEIFPLVKTGGLGDVIAALPPALARSGVDARLLLPGYPAILAAFKPARKVASFGAAFGAATIDVRFGALDGVGVRAYVIDAPFLYGRAGHPYVAPDGSDWSDNALRFGLLAWIAAHLGAGDLDRRWRPQIVHGHDWHAALACAYLALHPAAPCRTVFTIHNLAFQGLFEPDLLPALQLPQRLFTIDGIEFFGSASPMKAGIRYADRITTVSPTYAREIRTPEFGCGLEGALTQRAAHVHGILNGVDGAVWNPARDPYVDAHYDGGHLEHKQAAKRALQAELGLHTAPDAPLFGVVSRLTQQKGIDLVARIAPELIADGAQFALLGSGEAAIENALRRLAAAHPQQVAVRFGYDEALAHRIIAGADLIALPSRFEPCGLTQLYGLRYGALPLVRRVGGLADTVVDADAQSLAADTATGFGFEAPEPRALLAAARRAIALYRDRVAWRRVQQRAMAQDFSWDAAAARYIGLYRELTDDKR